MRYYYQVLSLASGVTSPSLLFFLDSHSYLFNVGDNFQRMQKDGFHRTKIHDIFVTSLHSESIGGLPGLMLSLVPNSSVPRRVHGPYGLSEILRNTPGLGNLANFDVREYGKNGLNLYRDEQVTVNVVSLDEKTVSYVVEGMQEPRKVDIEKINTFGVYKRQISQLIKGEEIYVNDKIVRPEDVLEPFRRRPVFSIVQISEQSQLSSLSRLTESISPYLQDLNFDFCSMIHTSPEGILISEKYAEMVRKLPKTMTHAVLHETEDGKGVHPKAEARKITLNSVFPTIFPLSKEFRESKISENAPFLERIWDGRVVFPKTLWKYILCPAQSRGPELLSETDIPSFQPPLRLPSPIPLPNLSFPQYSTLVKTDFFGSDPVLTFLGTASATPGPYRNVAGIHITGWGGGLLLDCGEGSFSQLLLQYGTDGIAGVLRELKVVLISHMHPDHNLGLGRLLMERSKITKNPLLIVGPRSLSSFLTALGKFSAPVFYRFIDSKNESIEIQGLSRVRMIPVLHNPGACGVVLEHSSGWKLVYSGDTRPSQSLIDSGQGATVLIHEATFDDSQQNRARLRMHSTVSEALAVARAMKAWRVILTHFSQRYRVLPAMEDSNAILAFDHMSLRLSDCEHSKEITPTLLSFFSETDPSLTEESINSEQ